VRKSAQRGNTNKGNPLSFCSIKGEGVTTPMLVIPYDDNIKDLKDYTLSEAGRQDGKGIFFLQKVLQALFWIASYGTNMQEILWCVARDKIKLLFVTMRHCHIIFLICVSDTCVLTESVKFGQSEP